MGGVKDVQSKEELAAALSAGESPPVSAVVHFWTSWCEASKQMDRVFSHLSAGFPHALLLRVEAEEQPEISEAYAVSTVPYFVFCKDGATVDTLEGANPSTLANKVAKIAGSVKSVGMAAGPTVLETTKELGKENGSSQSKSPSSGVTNSLKNRLQQLADSHPVFLFMKGTPEQPSCGFSREVVDILKEVGVEFGSFDILTDDEVREGMKRFSNWPTFPQLYCKGVLLGGCDIAVSMHESGELKDVLSEHGIPVGSESGRVTSASGGVADSSGGHLSIALRSRIESLIDSNPVIVFMKGRREEPKCGFSRKVVDILEQEKVSFGSFDILSDDEVRQGLKVFSNWSSYPQLYIKGELIGGSDIVLEKQKSGELRKVLTEKGVLPKERLEDQPKDLIWSLPTMLFLKGKPDTPRYGFNS